MAIVTYANLFSESRANVLALISNTANVSDPTISSNEFRKWIYSREPDVKASDFSGYPFIIVNPATADTGEKGSVDGKSKNVSWVIEVEIVTSDRGYGGKDGQGLSNMDTLSDSLIKTFNNVSNRSTLRGQSMSFSKPETTDVVPDVIADEKVFRRSIMLPFMGRIHVSA